MSKNWAGQGQKGNRPSDNRVLGRIIPNPKLKLLDQCREIMRLKHYSLRTERCYCDWIRRYIHFHKMRLREELTQEPKAKIELFLSDLAVNGKVAAATQNQAFNALLFLYRDVLDQVIEGVDAVRADRPVRVPVVLTVDETRRVFLAMSGTTQLVVKLLYGSGLRLLEGLRLRVQDLDLEMKQVTVRDGKGAKDRYTTLAEALVPVLREHLQRVRLMHEEDLKLGFGAVYLGGVGSQVSQGGSRMALAVCFPGAGFIQGSQVGTSAASSFGRSDDSPGDQGGGGAGGNRQECKQSYIPA